MHLLLLHYHAAAFAFGLWLLRKLQQCCLTSCVVTASQETYNKAWQGMQFVLDYRQAAHAQCVCDACQRCASTLPKHVAPNMLRRVSDMMLGLCIILMFGSGMVREAPVSGACACMHTCCADALSRALLCVLRCCCICASH